MPLYRCQNADCSTDPAGRLIFDFEAAAPVCPKCGADGRKPEFRAVIVKREAVHYHVVDPAGPDAGFGKRRRIACETKGSLAGKHATGHVLAVTCPKCKLSPEWREAALKETEFGTPEELDFPVQVDLKAASLVGTPPDRPGPGVEAKKSDCGCG